MSFHNWLLMIGGVLLEGAVCYVAMWFVVRTERRDPKPSPKPRALTGELIPRRPELPAPPRKELPR